MPIIVGGTNYYIESLLWNTLIKSEVSLRTHKHVYVFLSYKHDRLGWTWLYDVRVTGKLSSWYSFFLFLQTGQRWKSYFNEIINPLPKKPTG